MTTPRGHAWTLVRHRDDPSKPDDIACEACGIAALRYHAGTEAEHVIDVHVKAAVKKIFEDPFGDTFRPESVPPVDPECSPPYTPESVRAAFEPEADRLFAPWTEGRGATYTPDPRTKELVGLGFWIREELSRLGFTERERRTQEARYNRESRSHDDLFACAARVLNEAKNGVIDIDRRPLRRWG